MSCHEGSFNKSHQSVQNILTVITANILRSWMKRWGFRFKKSDNFSYYIEKKDVMWVLYYPAKQASNNVPTSNLVCTLSCVFVLYLR